MNRIAVAALLVLLPHAAAGQAAAPATSPAPAAAAAAPAAPRIALRGFVSTTLFVQDHSFGFGNGQAASWAAAPERAADPWFLGGDVRNTRLTMQVLPAAQASGWQPSATVEGDFFGAFNGTGAFSDEQPQLRLRLAFVEFGDGRTTLRIGQATTPLCGFLPVSTSHIAFPLGLGSAGMIGWRFPGIFATRRLHQSSGMQVQVQGAAFRGSWDGPGSNLEQQSAGETAAVPQLEARLDVTLSPARGPRWSAYVVGHYDRKDLSGIAVAEDDVLEGTALQVGARMIGGPLTLQGNAYTGRAIGQQFGQLMQYGDIGSRGGWAQAGYAVTPAWSAWLFTGLGDADDADLAAFEVRVRTRNMTHAAMVRRQVGTVSVGVEWIQARTDWRETGSSPITRRTANQLALSALYQF